MRKYIAPHVPTLACSVFSDSSVFTRHGGSTRDLDSSFPNFNLLSQWSLVPEDKSTGNVHR